LPTTFNRFAVNFRNSLSPASATLVSGLRLSNQRETRVVEKIERHARHGFCAIWMQPETRTGESKVSKQATAPLTILFKGKIERPSPVLATRGHRIHEIAL
jgi:hypothetical protein